MKRTTLLRFSAISALALSAASQARADGSIYQTNFDSLTLGHTQPFPGAAGQDGWYQVVAVGAAVGEIESSVAHSGRALHELAPATNQMGLQTIDQRDLAPFSVSNLPKVTLNTEFYSHSSDVTKINVYDSRFFVEGQTAQGERINGSQVIGFHISAGDGVNPKSTTGIIVSLDEFNGLDNNDPVFPAIGRHLAFDTWHAVSLSINPAANHYISLTIDGQTADLSAVPLPRDLVNGQWVRLPLVKDLEAQIIPEGPGMITNDDVYWDNLNLTYVAVPEPPAVILSALAITAVAIGLALRRICR